MIPLPRPGPPQDADHEALIADLKVVHEAAPANLPACIRQMKARYDVDLRNYRALAGGGRHDPSIYEVLRRVLGGLTYGPYGYFHQVTREDIETLEKYGTSHGTNREVGVLLKHLDLVNLGISGLLAQKNYALHSGSPDLGAMFKFSDGVSANPLRIVAQTGGEGIKIYTDRLIQTVRPKPNDRTILRMAAAMHRDQQVEVPGAVKVIGKAPTTHKVQGLLERLVRAYAQFHAVGVEKAAKSLGIVPPGRRNGSKGQRTPLERLIVALPAKVLVLVLFNESPNLEYRAMCSWAQYRKQPLYKAAELLRISAATVASRASGHDPHGKKVLSLVGGMPRDVIARVIHAYRTGQAPPLARLPAKRRKVRASNRRANRSFSGQKPDVDARGREFEEAFQNWVTNTVNVRTGA